MFGEKVLKDALSPLLKDAYNLLRDEGKQIFSNRLLEYQNELYKKCNYQKTLLHRFEDILIEDFYIPLYLRPYTGYGIKTSDRLSTSSIKNILHQNKNIIIFGYAGSGKSTLVKYLIVSALKEKFKIPIYIELRNLTETSGNFDKYILNNIFQYQKIGISNSIIERLLEKSHFLFVLDGFDEIPSNLKTKVSQSISDFNLKYPNNNCIITSRYYEPLSILGKYKNYEICELTRGEVNLFISKQFNNQNDSKAKEIISELGKAKNSTIKEYLKTPLLLSLFIITYLTHPEIPFNKSEFYYNVFDSLFYRLDKYLKSDFVHEKVSKLSKEDFIKVLSIFSFITTFETKYEFSEKYMNEKIDLIKDIKQLRFETQDFLTDITSNIGIMLLDGIFYKFPHRTIQDYFCANFLVRITDSTYKKKIYFDIARHASEYLFLIELLLEIDYVDTLEHLLLPMIYEYIEQGREAFNIAPISIDIALTYNRGFNYILDILEMDFELRYIKSNFIKHHLSTKSINQKESDDDIIFENSISKELKKDVLRQIEFVDNAKSICASIIKHIEKIKKEDKQIIDVVKNSR